ncbi:popeye domain-containing protein 3-like isoform X2 [Temnothorax longispinosus]|uniref:popeye domain-containing protein 3-like isoform X2 n=1 Tax=Temnothorax longispinosus TaxID=300112 RepID=UPI003A9A0099
MARVTRPRQKMANTTDSPATAGGSLLSSSTTPFPTSSTSTASYSNESYTFNYSGLPNLGGYSLDDFNYTELWLDVWNGTEVSNVTERLNATVLSPGSYCNEWEANQSKLFQAANIFFAAAFLVPRSLKASIFALRSLLTLGFMLAALWAGSTICALDAMLWCLALGLVNGIHSLILACQFLPPALNPELAELYLKVFAPYKVNKQHFQELAKEARILKLDSDQTYATEGVTPADTKLSVLLRGKLRVTCDGTHLHYIRAYQFVDSLEWEATHEHDADVFQVTIRAEEPSTYICWTRMKLLRVLRHRPVLKVVLYTLIENSPARHSHQYWTPVVANHFPPTSPFIQSQNLGYSLLPQGVQFSPPPRVPVPTHAPVVRQRSGGAGGDYTLLPQTPKLERKRSKKGTREVTFETPV